MRNGGLIMQITEKEIQRLLDHMIKDYEKFVQKANFSSPEESIQEFKEDLEYSIGNKYIKITGDHSVKGFIVNTTKDKKFQYGDMLMAAGWNKPARNYARGNIFDETYTYTVKWTGIS